MPNWTDIGVEITGPHVELERFKRECLTTLPPQPGSERDCYGIDFAARQVPVRNSEYWRDKDGRHVLWIRTWSNETGQVIAELERISAAFPELTFETSVTGEFGNFAYRGQIENGITKLERKVMAAYDQPTGAG